MLNAPPWRPWRAQVTVRAIRFAGMVRRWCGHRVTLVTTLWDPRLYSAGEVIASYARRWRLELCWRDLKTTLGI